MSYTKIEWATQVWTKPAYTSKAKYRKTRRITTTLKPLKP